MTPGKVKRIIDAELKFEDTFLASLSMPATVGRIVHLSNVAIGTGESERIGNWIKPVTLYGVLSVQADETNLEPFQPFRIAIVQWRENQNVDSITLPKLVQGAATPFQGYNVESKGAFKILWTWVGHVIGEQNNPQYIKNRRFYLKPRTKVLFDDADFRKYHLFLVGFSDNAAMAPTVYGNVRLRYTDA